MCTATTLRNGDFYFGRNLDLGGQHGEKVLVVPRAFPLSFRHHKALERHEALIGMGVMMNGYPLFYDGANESGLAVAGLNFPGNAVYSESIQEGRHNVAVFEFIPWLLTHAGSVDEAELLLSSTALLAEPSAPGVPTATLHWMISDKEQSITVETLESGMKVYDNPVGVLTNNPPFDMQMFALRDYMSLHTNQVENTAFPGLDLEPYSRGFGGLGLPGDLSSKSRFIKAAFTKMNSLSEKEGDLSQFFHILDSVCQQRGLVHMGDGKYEITIYSSCCDLDTGVYYYKTYDCSQIKAVRMRSVDLDGSEITVSLIDTEDEIKYLV